MQSHVGYPMLPHGDLSFLLMPPVMAAPVAAKLMPQAPALPPLFEFLQKEAQIARMRAAAANAAAAATAAAVAAARAPVFASEKNTQGLAFASVPGQAASPAKPQPQPQPSRPAAEVKSVAMEHSTKTSGIHSKVSFTVVYQDTADRRVAARGLQRKAIVGSGAYQRKKATAGPKKLSGPKRAIGLTRRDCRRQSRWTEKRRRYGIRTTTSSVRPTVPPAHQSRAAHIAAAGGPVVRSSGSGSGNGSHKPPSDDTESDSSESDADEEEEECSRIKESGWRAASPDTIDLTSD